MISRHGVIVVGGGLVGCLITRALATEGGRVVLLERNRELGAEASSAAAGMLSPQMEAAEGMLIEGEDDAVGRTAAMLDLCLAARRRYPGFVRELEAETGRGVGYRTDGTLVVALTEGEVEALQRQSADQRDRGLRADWLDTDRAHALEPGIAPAARGALYLPDDHRVDNVALSAAAAGAILGNEAVEIRLGTKVRALAIENGRVTGVETSHGRIAADVVVLATGAWSGRIEGLPRPLPVHPVKGQMAAVLPDPVPITATVGGRGVYCVPRADGRVIVGATVERTGFDRTVNPAATDALLAEAARVVPALGEAPFHSGWAGLRPGTADDLPVFGPDPDVGGLFYATGHYRNGILLAPLTADWIAALLRGDDPPADPEPFRPDRFDAS